MKGIIKWFVENRIAANLFMVGLLIAGITSLYDMKRSVIPDITADLITISIPYSGASPNEVERGVIVRVEAVVGSLPGVESINSIARAGRAQFRVNVELGFEPKEIADKIRYRVNSIRSFPGQVGQAFVKQVTLDRDLVSRVVLYGPASDHALKRLAKRVRDDLLTLPGISNVVLANVAPNEIGIDVSEWSLQRYGISFSEVASAIKRQSVNMPLGNVATGHGVTNISVAGQADTEAEFEELVVRSLSDGGRVLLRDVAVVNDKLKQSAVRTEFNGKPAVYLNVFRVGNQDILKISETLHHFTENPPKYLPENIKITLSSDVSRYFKSRVDLLIENAAQGLVMLLFVLVLFLGWRLSFWVSLGIPVAFMATFAVLPQLDITLNMVSLFALILVLGIVVDDAIIVGENIHRQQCLGYHGKAGAIRGAQEVAKPVIFAAITTMVMFLPLYFLPGTDGKMMRILPMVIVVVLFFSLLESLLILPAHLANQSVKQDPPKLKQNRGLRPESILLLKIKDFTKNGLDYIIQRCYLPGIQFCLRWRYGCVSVFIATLTVMVSLLMSGHLTVVFLTTVEGDVSVANIRFPLGTDKVVTHRAVKRIETAAFKLKDELREATGEEQIISVISNYGIGGREVGDHLGSVSVELLPSEKRKFSGREINKKWRQYVGAIDGIEKIHFDATLNEPGPSVDIQLSGVNLDSLKSAADQLKAYLTQFDGVYHVHDTFQRGQQAIELELNPLADDLGVQLEDVAMQVRQAFYGVELQSVQRNDEEVKVILRYPEKERDSLWYLENMQIRLASGALIPLMTIANVKYTREPVVIKRSNRKRFIRVKAFVDKKIADSQHIMRASYVYFNKQIMKNHPDIKWGVAGVQKNKQRFTSYLQKSLIFALLGMYTLMAILFKSYAQPFIVMFAIPFGLLGALFGHILVGIDLDLWSMIGMTAVSGVVVNDNLVLVDYINRKRSQGVTLYKAICTAGMVRFRPVILTSITTFMGLTPLMLEKSVQAQFLLPMVNALAFGVLFATLISLIFVPISYCILEDVKLLLGKMLRIFKWEREPIKKTL